MSSKVSVNNISIKHKRGNFYYLRIIMSPLTYYFDMSILKIDTSA